MEKKVLVFLITDKPGGAEKVIKLIVDELVSRGYLIDIIFFKKSSFSFWSSNKLNVNLFYINLFNFLSIVKYLTKGKYEFSLSTTITLNCLNGLIKFSKLIKINTAIARESTNTFKRYKNFKRLWYLFFYKIGYRFLDTLIFQTDEMKKNLLHVLPSLNNGLNLLTINNPFKPDFKLNSKLNFSFDYIVAAGRLIEEKGFDILINAFSIVLKKYPKLKLFILGNGKKYNDLNNQINDLNIQNSVTLLGYKENVYTYFSNSKVCVISSRIEGFPNVIYEMMSCCNNVIATKCIEEIDSIPGIIKLDINEESIANGIITALESSNDNSDTFKKFLKSRNINNYVDILLNQK